MKQLIVIDQLWHLVRTIHDEILSETGSNALVSMIGSAWVRYQL